MSSEHPDYYHDYQSDQIAYEWAAENYACVDEYFKQYIENDIIRETFVLGLAYGYKENDPTIGQQIGDSGFDDVTYAYVMQDTDRISKLYIDSNR